MKDGKVYYDEDANCWAMYNDKPFLQTEECKKISTPKIKRIIGISLLIGFIISGSLLLISMDGINMFIKAMSTALIIVGLLALIVWLIWS